MTDRAVLEEAARRCDDIEAWLDTFPGDHGDYYRNLPAHARLRIAAGLIDTATFSITAECARLLGRDIELGPLERNDE